MEKFKDDRSQNQLETHTCIIAGQDTFLSSWGHGEAHGGSTAAWACTPQQESSVYAWVASRSDMANVRKASVDALRKVPGLVHVYAVGEGHPALHGSGLVP